MKAQGILKVLQKLGKPGTAAIYRRHGSGDNVFGVLTSEIVKLRKRIKTDHSLAIELWNTGNAEARILALQIADPRKLTSSEADAFANEAESEFVGCYLSSLLARSPLVDEIMSAWMKSSREFVRAAGYGILGARLKEDPNSVTDAGALSILAVIEKEIHRSPNRARYAMNGALIGIGVFKPSLRKQVIEAAKRIGKVEVDHGETSCTTPDAVSYITKAAKRKHCP